METHAHIYTHIHGREKFAVKKKTFSDLSENQLAFDIKAFCRYSLKKRIFLGVRGN